MHTLDQTLMSHYAPKVSDLVNTLVSPSDSKQEAELRQYLDMDHDDVSCSMMSSHCCGSLLTLAAGSGGADRTWRIEEGAHGL